MLKENAEQFHSMSANVLPIRNGKVPAIEWDHLQNEKQSLEELQSYDWTLCPGLGIISGPGGYVCIDIDKIKNNTVISTILRELNLSDNYQWQVRSGSGLGFHIWIRISEPLPFAKGVIFGNSKDDSFDHIEIRWKDCQTLVPPSLHLSGKNYEWINGTPTLEPDLVSIEAIIAVFEAVAFVKIDDPQKDKPKYRKTDYTDIILNGVVEGKRNDTIASMAGHLRKRGLEYSEALEWLKLWNSRIGQPLSIDEVETTVTSIFSMPSSDIVLRDGMEMNLMPMPVLNDIVDGVIGEKSFNFLAGEEGAGKSLLAMNLGLAIATGAQQFLGYKIKKHGKVLYLNNELPFAVFLQRFKKMRTRFYAQQSVHLGNFLTPEIIKPLTESMDDIVKIIHQHQPVLVVLDCLYFAHDKKENDSSEMKQVMRQLLSLRDQHGVAVIVVHHTKKGVRYETMHNDNIRGSQVFSASADTNILFRRSGIDESKRLFKLGKVRDGEDSMRTAHLLALNPGDLWFEDLGEVNEDDHILAQGEKGRSSTEDQINFSAIFGSDMELKRKTIVERCTKLGFGDRTIDRCLNAASGNDGILHQPKFGWYALKSDDSDETPAMQAA
ncbi:MAG: AAA family ATPase [Bacteroidota bacterium]